jgi:hypothetical protein
MKVKALITKERLFSFPPYTFVSALHGVSDNQSAPSSGTEMFWFTSLLYYKAESACGGDPLRLLRAKQKLIKNDHDDDGDHNYTNFEQ